MSAEVRRWVSPGAVGTESYRGLQDTEGRTVPDHDEGPFYVLASDYDAAVKRAEELEAALGAVQAKLAEYLERLLQRRTLPNRWVGEINDIVVKARAALASKKEKP